MVSLCVVRPLFCLELSPFDLMLSFGVLIFKIFLQHSNTFKLCETLMIQMKRVATLVILSNFSTPRGPPHPRVREINYARKGDYIYEINLHYD